MIYFLLLDRKERYPSHEDQNLPPRNEIGKKLQLIILLVVVPLSKQKIPSETESSTVTPVGQNLKSHNSLMLFSKKNKTRNIL